MTLSRLQPSTYDLTGYTNSLGGGGGGILFSNLGRNKKDVHAHWLYLRQVRRMWVLEI